MVVCMCMGRREVNESVCVSGGGGGVERTEQD